MSKKATTIEEIYHNFAQEKYLDKDSKEFYVNLYSDDLRRFVTALKDNKIPSKSFFIAGQSGNGKSTVLNLLTTEYPFLEDRYIFHYVAGRQIFLYEDVDIVDVLLMVGYKLTATNSVLQKRYLEKLQKLEDVKSGALVEEEIISQKEAGGFSAKAYLSVGAKFFGFLKAGGNFESTYKINEEVRQDARRFFKLNKNRLIDLINSIILDYKKESGDKDLLIVLDDLEKKENIDRLFTKELYLLNELKLVKIVTMPIHLQRTETFNNRQDIYEFALKLKDYEGNVYSHDIDLLREVILKRIENLALIENDVVEKAILLSGGNLRQLIKLIHFSANEALAFESNVISKKELEASIMKLQREYSSKVMLYRTFLNTISEFKMPTSDTQEDLENLAKVTKQSLIFAYFNGFIWYELNPIIEKTLKIYNRRVAKS